MSIDTLQRYGLVSVAVPRRGYENDIRPVSDGGYLRRDDVIRETTYNGWTNRETWALVLHLDNEEDSHNEVRALVAETSKTAESNARADYPDWSDDLIAGLVNHHVSEAVKDYAERYYTRAGFVDAFPQQRGWPDALADAASDIGSLWRVNWSEVARHFLSE